jgi:mannose-1-phosphate guanylyltransferase/mannose-6-phosphate isomerase
MFTACPNDSIDYAVMEKIVGSAKKGGAIVVPLDAGWSDVGSWASLWQASEHDAEGNVKKGDVHAIDSKNNVLIAEHRLLATVGLENIIAVETADAVLVAHKDHSQDIKKIVDELKRNNKTQYQTHRRVSRPWGYYESIDNGERFQVKRITVNPRAALSLQMHHHRAEHWIVVKGTAKVTRGDETLLVSENQSTYIPVGMKHRLENPGTIPLELIEVQSGSYLGEDDIVRFEDVYGR